MALSAEPLPSKNFADFGGDANPAAATIRYDLPLPNSHVFSMVTPIPLAADTFLPYATERGVSLESLGVLARDAAGQVTGFDQAAMERWFQRLMPVNADPSLLVAANAGVDVARRSAFATNVLPVLAANTNALVTALVEKAPDLAPALAAMLSTLPSTMWERMLGHDRLPREADDVETRQKRRDDYAKKLAEKQASQPNQPGHPVGTIVIPTGGFGTSVQTVPLDIAPTPPKPAFALVETWQLTAFLGDYGLGQTVGAESLMPGESKTISVQTWSADTSSKEQSTSIFDSSDSSAQTRFTEEIAKTDNTTTTENGGWAASVGTKTGASAQVYMVNMNAEVEASFSANHQDGRQSLDGRVDTSVNAHANQCNSARKTAVGEVTQQQRQEGSIGQTTRELSNTNLRRVLNFVFRELNQEYDTVTSLRDVKVAFFNGKPDSAEIVSLGALRTFLARYCVPAQIDDVARDILSLIVDCIDEHGNAQTMLQVGTRAGGVFDWQDATLDADGTIDFLGSPVDPMYSWRIKPGPLGQDGEEHHVPGVVTGRTSVVLRTNSVVVEALLGQADALDPYAAGLQEIDLRARSADLAAREAETRRLIDALDLVKDTDADKKVEAWNTMLGARPQVDVNAIVDGSGKAGNTP